MDLKEFFKAFEGTLRRNVAPAFAFFVIFGLGNLVGAALRPEPWRTPLSLLNSWTAWLHQFSKDQSAIVVFGAGIAFLAGTSYMLATLQSLLIDNTLKYRFETRLHLYFPSCFNWLDKKNIWRWLKNAFRWLMISKENKELKALRTEAVAKLRTIHPVYKHRKDLLGSDTGDFLLYELIGDFIGTDTRGFVDEAKAMGIVCLSVAITAPIVQWIYWGSDSSFWVSGLIAFGSWYVGRELVKTQYRHRAYRLYLNLINRSHILEEFLLREYKLKPEATGDNQQHTTN